MKMRKNDKILKRQSSKIFFRNEDTDFFFNWLLGISELFGMSHGELYYLAHKIGRGAHPEAWRSNFTKHAEYLSAQATQAASSTTAANYYIAATYAYRAVLQFTDPFAPAYTKTVHNMEESFSQAADSMGVPIEAIRIGYHESYLPGYYVHCDDSRPTLMMVGGGDTSREDLFYFAGYPGWRRNYNVLMVDLPGQGTNPARGLTFTVDASESISACIDWLQQRNPKVKEVAIYGVSGGGYFTAQAAEKDSRIHAWIASTPIYDVAELFRQEFGAALKAPGWFMNSILKIVGDVNPSADINLKKYAWQFGTKDFRSAIDEVFKQAVAVKYDNITCPSLFLMGEGEGAELRRQTIFLQDELTKQGNDVTLHEFTAESGADAHCQLNNLRLVHNVVFDWLDKTVS